LWTTSKRSARNRSIQKKQATADQVGKIAGAIERATEELDRSDFPSIAAYANQISARIKNFANGLRDRNVEELLDDVRQAARRNPKMFFIGSIAAGVALSRFFKATERYDSQGASGESWNSWESNWAGTSSWDDSSSAKTRFEDERMESTPGGNIGASTTMSNPIPSKGV